MLNNGVMAKFFFIKYSFINGNYKTVISLLQKGVLMVILGLVLRSWKNLDILIQFKMRILPYQIVDI